MTTDDTSVFAVLDQLRTEWPGGDWSWDERMCCVTDTFTDAMQDKVRAMTLAALPAEYTSANIATASAPLTELVNRRDGLRDGQFLFAREDAARVAFGLWWPWGAGTPISLRIGFLGVDENDEPNRRLREIFNVAG